MPQCLVGIGSNLGDRAALLESAVECLGAAAHTRVVRASRWYRSQPIGGPTGQAAFLNGAVLVETSLDPPALLQLSQAIEQRLGRQPNAPWSARPIDVDLLLFESTIVATNELTVPHRWLAVRRFALAPAAELVGDWIHPVLGWSIARLLRQLDVTEPTFVGVGATSAVAREVDAQLATLVPQIGGQGAATSSVPNSASPIEWVEYAEAETTLSGRFAAEAQPAELPRAVMVVATPGAAEPRQLLDWIVGANRCPFVVSDADDTSDQVRELVGAVLATLPIEGAT